MRTYVNLDLSGKTAVVTGASSGSGRSWAGHGRLRQAADSVEPASLLLIAPA